MPRVSFPSTDVLYGQSGTIDAQTTQAAPDGTRRVLGFSDDTDVLWETTDNGRTIDTLTVAAAGSVVDERTVARFNHAFGPHGLTLHRNFRTKGHGLRGGAGNVVWFDASPSVTAERTSHGWALNGSAAPSPKAPKALPKVRRLSIPKTPPTIPAQPEPEDFGEAFETAEEAEPEPVTVVTAPEPNGAPDAVSIAIAASPTYRGTVVLPDHTRRKWQAARACAKAGKPKVVAFVGPSGAGKTHAVFSLAAEEGLSVVRFDASGMREPGDWFVAITVDSDGTHYVPTDFLRGLTAPGARVMLVDEFNRADVRALNAVLPIFEYAGAVTNPHTGQAVKLNPEVQLVITANIGSAFGGTDALDEAIRNRISVWNRIDHLDEAAESALLMARSGAGKPPAAPSPVKLSPRPLSQYHADTLASLAAMVRAGTEAGGFVPVSTRQLLAAADLIEAGLPAREAVDAAILDGYDPEGDGRSEAARVKTHVAGLVWDEPKASPDGAPSTGGLPAGVTIRTGTDGKTTAVIP